MRKICLILAIFCLFNSVSFAAESDVLKQLNIMTVKNDNHIVSKGEFATSIANIMGQNIIVDSNDKIFEDLDTNDEYYESIMTLVSYGILTGNGEGKINADKALTFNQAVKMTVCMLGYGAYAELSGGYPNGYLKVANEIKLLKKLKQRGEYWLEEYEATRLLLNALEIPLLEVSTIQSGNITYDNSTYVSISQTNQR